MGKPKWQKQGRTGPGPIAPRYAKRSDRAAVRKHGKLPNHRNSNDGRCCPMVAAVQSVKRGKFRLARRYAAMSIRLMAGV